MDVNIIPFLVLTVINGYWTWQGRRVQNDREIIKSLQRQIDEKDQVIDDMIRKKNEMKAQYHHAQADIKKLEGELKTYKQFHNHPENAQS